MAVKSLILLGLTVGALGAAPAEPAQTAASGERKSTLESVSTADDLILLERAERSLPPVQAGEDEPVIASFTARILPRQHYSRQRFDDAMSARFLDRYLDNLDNTRLHFLESDIQEFEKYRHELDDLTKAGVTTPSREIFERFLKRLEQRVATVAELLKTERFEFTGEDVYLVDREEAPRPKDLAEAKELWKQQLRFEILQELLTTAEKQNTTTNDVAASTSGSPEAAAPGSNGLTPEVEKTITRRYARLLKTLKDFEGSDVFQFYLSSLTHVYDPHSEYLGGPTLENFAINMNLSLFGIGAVLQSEDGYCKVRELRPGPAMRSKEIAVGDRIVAVAQEDQPEMTDVVDMKLSKIVDLIRGPKGTTVRLRLIPADAADPSERREVALVRDEIKLEDEEAKARILDLPDGDAPSHRIGIIDLPSFYASLNLQAGDGRSRAKSTTVDVARLLSKLKREDVEGIILDLRGNGGGSLEEAIDLTGLFIKEGPVVQVRESNDRVIIDDDPSSDIFYDGPMVVLINRSSASASEILAGCLQDYGRAVVVGDSSTHGKGTVQSLIQLGPWLRDAKANPGALKLTIRKFYRANGASTQLKGVTPDLVLPSVNNHADLGEASLDDPLPWDTIAPARNLVPENRIPPLRDELRRRSDKRVAEDTDFAYIQEDIAEYLKHKADKTVSLNLEQRLRERAEAKARLESRKQERKARPAPEETVYAITLKEVDLPGLPEPLDPAAEASVPAGHSVIAQEDTESPEEKGPAVDPQLNESKRILLDLIELSGPGTRLAGQTPATPAAN